MPSTTPEQNRQYQKTWYRNNKNKHLLQVAARKRTIINWLKSYKAGLCCSICDENHPACIDFHHKNAGDKKFDIATAVSSGSQSIAKIQSEIEKCDVLCSNCHRKLHWEERRLASICSCRIETPTRVDKPVDKSQVDTAGDYGV